MNVFLIIIIFTILGQEMNITKLSLSAPHPLPTPGYSSLIFEVSPDVSQESIEIAMDFYQIKMNPNRCKRPRLANVETKTRGVVMTSFWRNLLTIPDAVFIGEAAFSSWAMLASTLAHELEVHCVQNVNNFELFDDDLVSLLEKEAYHYEILNQKRFGLTPLEVLRIESTINRYYN